MRMYIFHIILLFSSTVIASEGFHINQDDIGRHISILSSDEFLGRAPATQGGEKTKDYIAKCSDPDPADKIIRNIDNYQSVALDKACIKKGISPPMLTAHQYMIDKEKYKNQTIDRLLVEAKKRN